MRVRQDNRGRIGGFAALLALIGMFVMSTGIALLVAAGPANASESVSAPKGGDKCDNDVTKVAAKKDKCDGPRDDCDNDPRKVVAKKDKCHGPGDNCDNDPRKVDGKKGDWCGNDDCIKDLKSRGEKGDWCGDECEYPEMKVDGKKRDWCGNDCDDQEMKVGGKKGHWCEEDEDGCEFDLPTKVGGEKPHRLCLVTPGAPTFADPTCDTDPSVTLPEATVPEEDTDMDMDKVAALIGEDFIDGVHYVISGDLVPGGTVEVTASPMKGYELTEDSTTFWEHTFSTPEDCETEVEPPVVVVDPPNEPVVSPEVVTPTLVSAGLPAAGTGNRTAAQGMIAAGLALLVGAGAMSLARRRSVTA